MKKPTKIFFFILGLAILSGSVLVFSFVDLGLVGYFFEKEKPKIEGATKKPEIKATSFIGKIVELDQDEIKIQVSASQNQGVEKNNMILVIRINQETRFIERETPKQIPPDRSPSDVITQKEIAFADLRIGDEIIAISQENIAWQREFTAQYILRTKLPNK